MLLALVLAFLVDARRGRLDALAVDGVELHTNTHRDQQPARNVRGNNDTYAEEGIVLFPPVEGAVSALDTEATISPTRSRNGASESDARLP